VIGDSTGESHATKAQNGTTTECSKLRFQSSLVDVYARFVLLDERGAVSYLLHRKAQFLVTDVVRPLLQVDDETVAQLRNVRVIDGNRPGQTSVQVITLCRVLLSSCFLCSRNMALPFGFTSFYLDILPLSLPIKSLISYAEL